MLVEVPNRLRSENAIGLMYELRMNERSEAKRLGDGAYVHAQDAWCFSLMRLKIARVSPNSGSSIWILNTALAGLTCRVFIWERTGKVFQRSAQVIASSSKGSDV